MNLSTVDFREIDFSKYKRILIVGCSGSGKSTLSKNLGAKLARPLHHLDLSFWQPGWVEPNREAWHEEVLGYLKQPEWVMEGGVSNLDLRLDNSDLVIYLDISIVVCVYRVIKRYFEFRKSPEPFLPKNCPNRLTWAFIKYILTFKRVRGSRIAQGLNERRGDSLDVIHIESLAELDEMSKKFLT